jgi:hypothetical protein
VRDLRVGVKAHGFDKRFGIRGFRHDSILQREAV